MQRFPNPKSVLTKLNAINQVGANEKYLYNRNPKNLEKLKIAYNHDGFHLEKPGKSFYNKLVIEPTGRYVTAKIVHVHDGTIMQATTKEWAIKKHLCKTSTASAYTNLARVLSERCLKIGIHELRCDIEKQENTNVGLFLTALEENGILLTAGFKRFDPTKPNLETC